MENQAPKQQIHPQPPPPPSPPSPTPPSPTPHKKPIDKPIIILSILLVLTFGIVIYLAYQYSQHKKAQVPSPQPTPTTTSTLPSPTPDPTADWETHINQEYKFSFKHPNNWEKYDPAIMPDAQYTPLAAFNTDIIATGISVDGGPKNPPTQLYISYFPNISDIDQWVNEVKDSGLINAKVVGSKKIGNNTFYEVSGISLLTSSKDYFIKMPTKGYLKLLMEPFVESTGNTTFNQILSTFKFIDQEDSAANWETYTSNALGITFNYPSEYKPPEERENYLSLISPLNPNRGKGYELQNGELKIEIWVEPEKEDNSPTTCWEDHNAGGGKILNQSQVYVNGMETTMIDWEGLGRGQFICLTHNKQRYLITKYPLETTRQEEFNQILSTFKFIE